MPRIDAPTPQISTSVPAVNAPYSRDFGQVGHAIAAVGSEIASTGADMYTKIRHADAMDAANTAYTSDALASTQKMIDLKSKYADGLVRDANGNIKLEENGQYRTIAHEFHEWADDRYRSNQDAMPNTVAQQYYKQQALRHFTNETANMQNLTAQMRVKAHTQNQVFAAQDIGGAQETTPKMVPVYGPPNADGTPGPTLKSVTNTDSFNDKLQTLIQQTQAQVGVTLNQTEADALQRKLGHIMTDESARNIYTNLLRQKKLGDKTTVAQDAEAYLALLRGEDQQSVDRKKNGLPTFSSAMDPVKREIEIDKMLRVIPSLRQKDSQNYMYSVKELAAKMKGLPDKPGDYKDPMAVEMISRGAQFVANGSLSQKDYVTSVKTIAGASIEAMINGKDFASQSPENQRQIYEKHAEYVQKEVARAAQVVGYNDPNLGSSLSVHLQEQGRLRVAKEQNARSKDMSAYSERLTPEGELAAKTVPMDSLTALADPGNQKAVRDAIDAQHRLQEQAEPNNRNYDRAGFMSKERSKAYAGMINGTGAAKMSSEQVARALPHMIKAYGADFPAAVDQMIKDKQLDGHYGILKNHMDDKNPDDLRFTIDALRGSHELKPAFKSVMGADNERALDIAVTGAISQWMKSQSAADPGGVDGLKFINGIHSAVKNGAMANALARPDLKGDLDAAAKDAFNKIIGNHATTSEFQGGNPWYFGIGGTKGYYSTPNQIGNIVIDKPGHETIRQNLQAWAKHDSLKNQDIFIPKGPNGADSTLKEFFKDGLNRSDSPIFPHFTYGGNGQPPGYYFTYTEKDGKTKTVRSASSNGQKTLVLPLEQMLTPR